MVLDSGGEIEIKYTAAQNGDIRNSQTDISLAKKELDILLNLD
jgi:hypothetical protein|tara:strand:+ start:9187 stop:9315 length:129 start_codon:yes stop_codon:yes gene_type:complete